MASVIEKQFIEKRQKTSSPGYSAGHNSKSAGFNSGFMSQFDQKPVHIKKRKNLNAGSRFGGLKKKWQKKGTGRAADHRTGGNNSGSTSSGSRSTRSTSSGSRSSKSSGFSFPVPSLATLAVAAGTIIIALGVLNWESIDLGTPDIFAFHPAEDEAAEQRIIDYASTGISGIMGTSVEIPEETDIEISLLAENNNTAAVENDNPHGMLVTFEWKQYRVQRGDTVSGIAQSFGVSVGAVIASNEISNARRIQEGALLRIPNIDGIPYQIKNGDSLSRISASFNVPLDVILDVNDIKTDRINAGETIFIPGARMNDIDLRLSLGDLFMYPLATRYITSGYGMRKDPFTGALQFHAGVDFRANTGTTIMASFDGVVSVVSENWLYGKYIIINHSNGYKTLYGHMSAYSVKQGDRVTRGRKIGEVGNTGYSTGPHLHFGIYDRNNKLVNPLELLN